MIKNKRGQVTIFIIIAIVVVVGLVLFFMLKSNIFQPSIPKQFDPAYSYYLGCIDSEAYSGALLLEQSGGYIENPQFYPGSSYMPFSSQLNFMGFGIPYWYYISGNGVKKEQIPTKEKMEEQLNTFLVKRIEACDFTPLEQQGFVIVPGAVKSVETRINDGNIFVKVNQELIISYGNSSWMGTVHSKEVSSNLGNFYDLAKKIYSYEKDSLFLENYGVDVLRLYAPVDGVNITCSPKIWDSNRVRTDLMNALEANVPQTKIQGDYYKLSKEDHKYFVKDIGESVEPNINFMYSRYWPMRMEVWPSEDGLMKADPVGSQEGLGMLGFCYVPYHFVYDLGYPVLVQIYSDNEIFQFPVIVYIDKNKPRDSGNASGMPKVVQELCEHKIANITVLTYNTHLEPVEADISFKCLDTSCNIGKTEIISGSATITAGFPQCVNGFVVASAQGYKSKKYLMESLNENNVQIFLDKKYTLDLDAKSMGKFSDYAIITFKKDNETTTVAYPEQRTVELTEGQYSISAYSYSDSEISLKGSTSQKCVEVPKGGFLGVFGFNEEKCFDLQVPDQTVDSAVSGGGKQEYYITESELSDSKKLVINMEDFGAPKTLEDLAANYNLAENSKLTLEFEK